MASIKPRFRAPKSAEAGEIMTLKTLISHPMESGQRKDKKTGEAIPRKIINSFTCQVNGVEAFRADLEPAISSPAYIEFTVKMPDEAAKLTLTWVEDGGAEWVKEATVKLDA